MNPTHPPLENTPQYTRLQRFEVSLAGREVIVFSKPGIPEWDDIPPAVRLLAEYAEIEPGWNVLQIGCGNGAGSVIVCQMAHKGRLTAWDASYVAQQCTAQTLAANHLENFDLAADVDVSGPPGRMDAALMLAPKGRAFGRRGLLMAHQALKPGGVLYLAGSKQGGIQPLIQDGEALFGGSSILGYKKGNRVAWFTRQPEPASRPDWGRQPGLAPGTWHTVKLEIGGVETSIESLPGIFSYDQMDEGSAFLLEHCTMPPAARVLDLGCGWGALGLWASGAPGVAGVDLVDSNLLAVAASRRNLARAGIPVRVFASDVTSAVHQESYTHVVTNPPFHVGKEVDYLTPQAFIQQAAQVLEPKGELWVVANKFIPYHKTLAQIFRRTQIVAENSKYHVIVGVK